jgi:flagellar hook-basal body complex protein FliE
MSPLSAIPAYNPALQLQKLQPQIEQLPGTIGSELPSILPTDKAAGSEAFSTLLGKMVSEVNAKQQNSADVVSALQGGQKVPLHQAMIAMEEASVSFQLMVEVRNKLLESYQEIMRMQI